MRSPLVILIIMSLVGCSFGTQVHITTPTLPNGQVGVRYSATVQAPGGCLPYIWKLNYGTLPAGLTLTGSSTTTSATVAGTPSMAQTSMFSIAVKGCGGHTASNSYTIVIASAPPPPPPIQHSVSLSWNPSTTSGVTYNVLRSTVSGGYYGIIASGLTTTSYVDKNIAAGGVYYYEVDAQDAAGVSGPSNQATAIVPTP